MSRVSMPFSGYALGSKELLMPDLDQIKQVEQASARLARGRSLKPPTIADAVNAGSFFVHWPEDIIEALKAVENRHSASTAPFAAPCSIEPPALGR
jgi:hypothetical protein